METLTIPSSVGSIGTYAFSGCSALISITLPEGITSIPGRAFQNCSSLTSVVIPSTVTAIATGAFTGSALSELSLPEDIDTVGNNAFPSGIVLFVNTSGGSMTFDSVDGTYTCIEYETNGVDAKIHAYTTPESTITVPDTVAGYTVSDIDSNAFDPAKKLIADLGGTVAELLSDYGYVVYDPSDLTMGLKKEDGQTVLAQYDGTETAITTPGYIDAIGANAFDGNSTIASIRIPSAVTLADDAFTGAVALTDVYLPDDMTSIPSTLPSHLTYWCSRTSDTAKALGASSYAFIDPAEPDFTLQWFQGQSIKTALRVVAYSGTGSTVSIPSPVTQVGYAVFKDNHDIVSVDFPDTIDLILENAFENAVNLTNMELPDSLDGIGLYAFLGTALHDITLPDNMRFVEGDTFPSGCRIHAAYHSWVSHVLSDCGLTFYRRAMKAGEQIETIVQWDSGLNGFPVGVGNSPGPLITKTVTVTESLPADNLFGCRYIDELLYVVTYNGEQDVITVPEGIEGVAYVFGVYNKMTEVKFPSTLKVIGYEAFKNCSGLTSITIPSTVVEIGYEAFAGSALRSIRLPDNVNKVGASAFRDCTNLASVTFVVSETNGVSVISDYAFYNTGLRTVSIPTTTVSIGEYAFAQSTKLSAITLPENGILESIGAYAFSDTGITDLTVPGTVEAINSYAFSNCPSLKTATLSEGVKFIGENAFYYDYALTSVALNSGVHTIGNNAFMNCTQLSSINLPDSVISIGEEAFAYTQALRQIDLPPRLATIANRTFQYSGLTSIVIPDSVITVGTEAFAQCYNLVNLTLSSKMSSLGTGAFNDCALLTWVEIPDTMTRLYPSFDNCTSAIIVLPDSVKYIQGIVFDDVRVVLGGRNNDILKSLDKFGYADERSFVYTYIGDDGIEDYDMLRVVDYIGTDSEATLPSAVDVIGRNAFANCTQLRKLILPDTGLTSIGTYAFHAALEVICTPGSDTHQMLISGGYPVEVAGYPGLYAVARDGKLYNASYHGNERIFDLPDNIASTDVEGTEGETEIYHPATFPASTQYRTTFDSLSAQTLGNVGYYITVAGLEDYSFRRNYVPQVYPESTPYEYLSEFLPYDTWFMVSYHGTDRNPVLPDSIEYICTDYLNVDSITLSSQVKAVSSIYGSLPSFTIYITDSGNFRFATVYRDLIDFRLSSKRPTV
ncbi:MAG: leucine-rich repeat protein [Clostridia bacterium]|nr:leucine-rich repeat protein [Clostridia bacterium]